MIKIVTIEREYGSGGGEIAQLLSTQLGWKLWDQLLTEEIARLANCPKAVVEVREERTDPLYYRLFKSFLRGSYEGSLNAHKLNVVDSETILKITERVVQHAAKTGNSVIVGRGSQHFLRNRPDTLRVFLYAPREDKVRRLLARGKSEKEAWELVDTVDRLIVDSTEWDELPAAYAQLTGVFDRVVVSDIAWARTSRWRRQLASLWPGIRNVERIRVTGTAAQAELLAGWLRSRLSHPVQLEHEPADHLEAVEIDGKPAQFPPGDPPPPSDLLSEELDRFERDRIYEEAVRSAAA